MAAIISIWKPHIAKYTEFLRCAKYMYYESFVFPGIAIIWTPQYERIQSLNTI